MTSGTWCSINKMVRRRRARTVRISSLSARFSPLFMPAAGSSSRSSARSSGRSARPTRASSAAARARVSRSSCRAPRSPSTPLTSPLRVRTWRAIITLSSADSSPKSRTFWNVRAMPHAATRWGGSPVMSVS